MKIWCRKCKEDKDIEEFNFLYKDLDIRYPICKTCRRRSAIEKQLDYERRMKGMSLTFKKCRSCGQLLSLTAFAVRRRSQDGRQPHCRRCLSAKHAEKQKLSTEL
jgi:hypothetical protein